MRGPAKVGASETAVKMPVGRIAQELPVTVPRALPPNASSFTAIPTFTQTCSTPASPMFPSRGQASTLRSIPMTLPSLAKDWVARFPRVLLLSFLTRKPARWQISIWGRVFEGRPHGVLQNVIRYD